MESFLLFCVIVIAIIRWFVVRSRFQEMSDRIDALSRLVVQQRSTTAPAPAPVPVPQPVRAPEPVFQAPPPVPVPVFQSAAVEEIKPPVVEPVIVEPPIVEPPIVEPPAPVERPIPAFQQPAAILEPTPVEYPQPAPDKPRRSSDDLEAAVGINAIKAGVFLVVIGIVSALGYSFTRVGPAGRVSMSLATSLIMLAAGVVLEPRERYRTFARGLIGGGWAALYFTVYAMQAIDAARVLYNPFVGAILLLGVAAGMIVHSLRYRSQSVTGLAYFIGFVSLGISQTTAFSVVALVPLAVSLLYISHRFEWRNFALFGLVATYAVCASRPDTGAPLWQAQAIFTVYWLVFETFDILHPRRILLPLNALGFLGLSLVKWQRADPDHIWIFLAAAAVAYLVGSIIRARSEKWHGAATLTAALFAAAIFLHLDDQWIAAALLIEGELFYLAGLRLDAPYLRYLGGSLFVVELGHLVVKDVTDLPARSWTPVGAASVVVFYVNRAMRHADTIYGYVAAAMIALVAGFEAPHGDIGLAWMVLAAGPFLVGWQWRQVDFRLQGYGLALLGPIGMAIHSPEPPLSLAIGAALSYAGALCAVWSAEDRFVDAEQEGLRFTGAFATTAFLATIIWRVVPQTYVGLAWMALAVVLLELGMRKLPAELRRLSYILAVLGAVAVVEINLRPITNDGPWLPRLVPAGAALLAYAMSARARKEEGGRVLDIASFVASGFLLTALWALLPSVAVGPAWAVVALILVEFDIPTLRLQGHLVSAAAFSRLFFANFTVPERLVTVLPVLLSHYYLWSRTRKRFYLYTAAILAAVLMRFELGRVFTATGWAALGVGLLYAGRRWKLEDLRWQSYALAVMAFARCWSANFYQPDMFVGFVGPVLIGATVVASLFAMQLLSDIDTRPRMLLSLLASSLLAILLYVEVSGSLLTVAWGVEGILLLVAGFPLRDRVLRLSGMSLLMFCILKLFVWDLRHLETLPRILSFIALGLILVAVSWIYTRFRETLIRQVLDLPAKPEPKGEPV